MFYAIVVFFYDTRMTVVNLLSYQVSLLIAHIRNPQLFLPVNAENIMEIIAFRVVILELTTLCIIVIVYFVQRFLLQAQERDEENMKLVEKQLEYYKDMELLDTEIRKFRHDINNHFACMEYLFEVGKTEELKAYFSDLKESTSVQKQMHMSGNEIIDAVLHYDLSRKCDERVRIKISGKLCSIKTVSSMDLCTVFSNLLSNAIKSANEYAEVIEKKHEKTSKINIEFSYGQKFFSIDISNSFSKDNFGKKVKRDKNHGHGLNKIQEVLEKYDGKLEQTIENQMINMKIYLPI